MKNNNEKMEKLKKILIDMDDVAADFTTARKKAIEKVPDIKIPWCQYKFFENLNPIKDAVQTIEELKEHFNIYFLTRPSVINPLCYTEKRVWIEKYFGYEMCKNLILCYDKTMVKGDYLIDDIEQKGRFSPEWKHIHFGTEKYPDWVSVKKYLLNENKK